jgi:capsule polysaccharide export protein KpsE/RkpR
MKQTKQSVAPFEEAPPELEPVGPEYLREEPRPSSNRDGSERLWLLWESRRFLLRATVWGLILSTMVAFVIPKRYDSTTRLMPPDMQSGSGLAMLAALASKGGLGLGSMAGGASDLLGMKSSGALFVDILASRTVEDRLIERFDLRKAYGDGYMEDARRELSNRTVISEDRKSGVLTITVTDRDPRRATQMAQAYVEELDRLVAQVSTSSARRERIFIEQRLQTVKQDLDTAARQFSEYASKNTTLDISSQGRATIEAAARLEGELIAAQSELEGLEQIYTKNNVRVRSLQAKVDELRSKLHEIGGNTSDSGSVPTSSRQEFPSIRQLPLLGVRWADLYRQTKIQETVYELLTQQYELAKIQEAKEIPVVKVLDAPIVPERKSSPKRRLIVIIGMLLALTGGVVWVLGTATWEHMDPEDPRKRLGQEIVATGKQFCSRLVRNWRTKRSA